MSIPAAEEQNSLPEEKLSFYKTIEKIFDDYSLEKNLNGIDASIEESDLVSKEARQFVNALQAGGYYYFTHRMVQGMPQDWVNKNIDQINASMSYWKDGTALEVNHVHRII